MNLSLDEYRALVAKAFRGVGYAWGLTEDASFAARRLAEFGLPSGEMVVRLLGLADGTDPRSRMPTANWTSEHGMLCSVCVGTALADRSGCDTLVLEQVAEPVLLAPFLQLSLPDAPLNGYQIRWADGICEISAGSIAVTGQFPSGVTDVRVERCDVVSRDPELVRRVSLDSEIMEALGDFAHRTYAPATEASRAGAGAGLTDND